MPKNFPADRPDLLEPCTPINGRNPDDGEYRIVDGTIVEQWSRWAGFWDVAYHATDAADAERYIERGGDT